MNPPTITHIPGHWAVNPRDGLKDWVKPGNECDPQAAATFVQPAEVVRQLREISKLFPGLPTTRTENYDIHTQLNAMIGAISALEENQCLA